MFLQEFVDGVPWVHLDIAGPAFIGSDDGYLPKGGTGFGVRTLIELASAFEPLEPSDATPAPRKVATRKAATRKTARKTATRKTATRKTASGARGRARR